MLKNEPMATSTPQGRPGRPAVLKEKDQNLSAPFGRKEQRGKKNKNFNAAVSTPNRFKENLYKPKNRPGTGPTAPRLSAQLDEKAEARRRQQAIESMKVQENRRLRNFEENLVEGFQKVALKVPESEDLLKQKLREQAKKLKEKRILAHLAEQEARKKKETETAERKLRSLGYNPQFRPKTGYSRCLYKPDQRSYNKENLPKVSENEELQPFPMFKPSYIKLPSPIIRSRIRYTKNDLRALNPYGFYFL